ncbi:ribonuclease E/G [Brevundimonas sp.]|uniref:Rne/Rng family ribonuclease n=1 Tax=Brevundimonas sp. TaxID=1871086 RepID=UPI0022C01428|nr:ribonuclease E/G [Brevundimonas sp.]MCZ8195183.1 ribonuclease E/G [Brevundimonas sp.]
MSKIMLIDAAHAEESRVAIVDGRQVEEFDFESRARRQLRGNIYLAKVTRVEPSLQAAFVEYGGNRHGFLAFNEIHPDYYQIPVADREAIMAEAGDDDDEDDLGRESLDDEADTEGRLADEERLKRRLMRRYKIQDVIKRRQILLVQVVKDERGAKGAALTTWLSLAGRYCVLMPNTGKGGGISRKITNAADRKRLKAAAASLEVPAGMGLIIRTAGAKRTKAEIKRDYEYLLRLWETIRETTLKSHAPSLIYEEENLVRRAVRDMFDKDFDGIQVEGVEGWKQARDFMRVLMPSQASKVHLYRGAKPLFAANGIEEVLHQIHQPVVPLKSGGYLVINQTEALVAIDVNSGRATRERNVEATATKTNLEAAVEAARQLRLRDLAGLIVIDFIDMDESKNNRAVEKALKDALAADRARIQMGRISGFGLMEISRQRRRLGVIEGATEVCPHCNGAGRVRSAESAALTALRAIDIEVGKSGAGLVNLKVPTSVALYILNHKRSHLQRLLERRGLEVVVLIDDALSQGEHAIDRLESDEEFVPPEIDHDAEIAALPDTDLPDLDFDDEAEDEDETDVDSDESEDEDGDPEEDDDRPAAREARVGDDSGRRRRRRRRGGRRDEEEVETAAVDSDEDDEAGRRRRRGRRGGRRVREDGDRDVYTWVRGRTPSLDQPYIWFDPLNPHAALDDLPPAQPGRGPAEAVALAAVDGDREERGSRRRRRRGRGRGGDRAAVGGESAIEAGGEEAADPEAVLEAGAEGVTEAIEAGAPALPSVPQRRRVRRKAAAPVVAEVVADDVIETGADPEFAVVPEPETAPAPVVAPVVKVATEPAAEPEPEPAVSVEEMVAADPAQITAPPPKPKRGWWRR